MRLAIAWWPQSAAGGSAGWSSHSLILKHTEQFKDPILHECCRLQSRYIHVQCLVICLSGVISLGLRVIFNSTTAAADQEGGFVLHVFWEGYSL